MTVLPRTLALVCLTMFGSKALGWGSYGHEQVNAAALDLLPAGTQIRQCLSQTNRNTIIRYAITPDADWKMLPFESRALRLHQLFANPKSSFSQATLKDELKDEDEAKTKHMRPGLVEALRADPTNPELLAQMKQDLARSLTNLSMENLAAKKIDDKNEHSLHFWEADAFTREISARSVLELADERSGILGVHKFSQDDNYDDMFKHYTERRRENAARILKFDPEKAKDSDLNNPTGRDVVQQGSAPWRIVQLYKLGLEEMRQAKKSRQNKDEAGASIHFKKALLAMGAMGHYVGDMGQPFHSSLNFDGQASEPPQSGIHHNFEAQILDDTVLAKNPDGEQNKDSGMWPDFTATHGEVLTFAARAAEVKFKRPLVQVIAKDPKHIVRSVMSLVAEGYDLVPEILDLHEVARQQAEKLKSDAKAEQLALQKQFDDEAAAKEKETGKKVKPKHATLRKTENQAKIFAKLQTKSGMTVLQSAEKRIADAAILLARLWFSALEKAGVKDKDLGTYCPAVTFDRGFAINNYPMPDYHTPLVDFNHYPPRDKADAKNDLEKVEKPSEEKDGDEDDK